MKYLKMILVATFAVDGEPDMSDEQILQRRQSVLDVLGVNVEAGMARLTGLSDDKVWMLEFEGTIGEFERGPFDELLEDQERTGGTDRTQSDTLRETGSDIGEVESVGNASP